MHITSRKLKQRVLAVFGETRIAPRGGATGRIMLLLPEFCAQRGGEIGGFAIRQREGGPVLAIEKQGVAAVG